MQSQIDTNSLNSSMVNRQFRYAEMSDINKPLSEQTPTHQIMSKETGRGKKWQLLSKNGKPLVYPTAQAAKADVAKLNKWKKSQKAV
ncbi:TPA: hypothetical protein ACMDOB_000530 [Vibrio metschnikovii]